MKPYVICHMVASVDGRVLIGRWRPQDESRRTVFEQLHDRLGVDAWLVGRVTGQEYAKLDGYSDFTDQSYPRTSWIAHATHPPTTSSSTHTAKSHGGVPTSTAIQLS